MHGLTIFVLPFSNGRSFLSVFLIFLLVLQSQGWTKESRAHQDPFYIFLRTLNLCGHPLTTSNPIRVTSSWRPIRFG